MSRTHLRAERAGTRGLTTVTLLLDITNSHRCPDGNAFLRLLSHFLTLYKHTQRYDYLSHSKPWLSDDLGSTGWHTNGVESISPIRQGCGQRRAFSSVCAYWRLHLWNTTVLPFRRDILSVRSQDSGGMVLPFMSVFDIPSVSSISCSARVHTTRTMPTQQNFRGSLSSRWPALIAIWPTISSMFVHMHVYVDE
ncbi:hypothetical protein BD310DRAFT_365041 [Dichomitus squalens]|uniref:Uncharacterized protein n=1 Tax=Dichomitus squalens TaxID=114155 RepID=A0A4Q9PZ37_9APHY|nr:hypothetical protein BD310DRAFT_365041 [Dichomitus squalens]